MKKLLFTLLILIFPVFVTGCFDNSDEEQVDEQVDEEVDEEKVKLIGETKKIYRQFPLKKTLIIVAEPVKNGIARGKSGHSLADDPKESKYVTVYRKKQNRLENKYSLSEEPGKVSEEIDFIHDSIDREVPVYELNYEDDDSILLVDQEVVPEECNEYKEAFGVVWCPEQGYVESVKTKDEDEFVEDYLAKFGPRPHGPEGYIEKLGGEGHGAEGYIEKFGEGHGPEGYIEKFGGEGHGPEGYTNIIGGRHGTEGYTNIIGGGHGPEGYTNIIGGSHGTEGYTNIIGGSHGTEGYTNIIGGSHGPEGYTNIVGGSHGPEGYTNIVGGSHGPEGYTNIVGGSHGPEGYTTVVGGEHGPEGYIEKFGPRSHGIEGYIEKKRAGLYEAVKPKKKKETSKKKKKTHYKSVYKSYYPDYTTALALIIIFSLVGLAAA